MKMDIDLLIDNAKPPPACGGQPRFDAFTEIQWVTVEGPNQHYSF